MLFKRNLEELAQIADLCRALRDAAKPELPPLIAVDQEGGRVRRLPPPALALPPMAQLGAVGDLELLRKAARVQAAELAALGFTMNLAPVLDVNTCPQNPVIGDRSFSDDARTVMRCGVAYIRGLQDAGVLACGKHFPGHGDTSKDSHLDLPVVEHDRARLERVELSPFRAAAGAGVAAIMTAHVEYPALEKGVPATMSRAICASLLRAEMGFEGALLSDDLEMKAIADRWPIEEAATEAVWAGCDGLLICSDEALAGRACEGLVHKAEKDSRFKERCIEAAQRMLRIRRLVTPRPVHPDSLAAVVGGPETRALTEEIARRLAA